MGMIAAIDADTYEGLPQMSVALQTKYRDRIGRAPASRTLDTEERSSES